MTPAARVAAAIAVLDDIAAGQAAEQALTRWARKSRFAGSKDRAAVRDHVFDVLRLHQTARRLGGGSHGRALMIGLLRAQEETVEAYFTGDGYGPAPLTGAENDLLGAGNDGAFDWNLPDWLVPEFQRSLGEDAAAVATALTARAPITLRVNTAKAARAQAVEALQADGIDARENPLSPTALTVIEGARRLRGSASYLEGLVELQDAASQAVVDLLPEGEMCLDFCAGGGGKALGLAASPQRRVYAHDVDPNRMKDISQRADRAGCRVTTLATADLGQKSPFDLVLCDAPCSGSGAWRRAPGAKWLFTQEALTELCDTQDEIMTQAAETVAENGVLAYATCSVLKVENEDRIAAFLAQNPAWQCVLMRRFDVSSDGDGFFTAHLTRIS